MPHTFANATLIDPEALENLRSLRTPGEPDLFAELVHLFLNDTPKRISLIDAAIKSSTAADLEAAAHSLKGSASNLGANTVTGACARLMQCAKSNDLTSAPALFEALEREFAKVKATLLEEIKR